LSAPRSTCAMTKPAVVVVVVVMVMVMVVVVVVVVVAPTVVARMMPT